MGKCRCGPDPPEHDLPVCLASARSGSRTASARRHLRAGRQAFESHAAEHRVGVARADDHPRLPRGHALTKPPKDLGGSIQAMLSLGELNSRTKDFCDLHGREQIAMLAE